MTMMDIFSGHGKSRERRNCILDNQGAECVGLYGMRHIIQFSFFSILVVATAMAGTLAGGREAGTVTTGTTQIVPIVVVGGGWSEKIILHNVDDKWSSYFEMTVWTKDGEAFPVEIVGLGKASKFTATIQPGKTLVLDFPRKDGEQQTGWASISQRTISGQPSGEYNGIGDMFGQMILKRTGMDQPDVMSSMILGDQAYSKLTIFFDNSGETNYTELGLLLSSVSSYTTTPVTMLVTIRDIDGVTLVQRVVEQKRGTMKWMNLVSEFPETVGKSGTVVVAPVGTASYMTGVSFHYSGNTFVFVTPFEE